MLSNSPSPQFERTAASSRGGCLSAFALPPLAVVCVSLVLAFLWLSGGSSPVSAAGSAQGEANLPQGSDVQPSALSPVFQPSVQYWGEAIQGWAAAAGLDSNLVATVMQIESCGDPQALSYVGAMGLFQVMPFHFAEGEDPYDPATNARRGLAYLARSLDAADGDPRLALAGYNGGIGVLAVPESDWAAETQRYAYWGSGIYAEASSSATESSRLQEWLGAGGASLCRQAEARLGINP